MKTWRVPRLDSSSPMLHLRSLRYAGGGNFETLKLLSYQNRVE